MLGLSTQDLQRSQRLLFGYEVNDEVNAGSDEAAPSVGNAFRLWYDRQIRFASFSERDKKNQLTRVLIIPALFLVGSVLTSAPFVLLFIGVYLVIEHAILRKRAIKRAELFERDYTALLVSLASAVRTGLDPIVALCESEKLFGDDSIVGKELHHFNESISAGVSEERAISRFGASINHPDIRLFRAAYILARREGSSLGECLHRLARVTRQRQSFRRKVKSALAMQKLSSIGIGCAAVAIGLIQAVGNPQALTAAMAHPLGSKALSFGGFLMMCGFIWMYRIARTRI